MSLLAWIALGLVVVSALLVALGIAGFPEEGSF